MTFSQPIIDIIRARSSWRSYTDQPLAAEAKDALRSRIENLPAAPFGGTVRMALLESFDAKQRGVENLGTYGVIKGAQNYLAGAVRDDPHAMEDFGFLLEWLILCATDLGLGTCWLGGTFQRGAFGEALGAEAGERLPAVTPVGYPSSKRSLVDNTFRFFARSKKRKDWSELFFTPDGQPLTKKGAGPFADCLEMVRLGPSASNNQPWRVIADPTAGQYALHLRRNLGYQGRFAVDLQRIDMGIAMCHFELTARELGLSGKWTADRGPSSERVETTEAIATWQQE